MSHREEAEPDRVHTCSLSRRHALAVGAGLMGGLAGCSGLSENIPGSDESGDDTSTEEQPLSETIDASAEFTIDEVTLDLDIGSYGAESLSGVLRLYSAPNLDRSNKTIVGEQSIEQTETTAGYTFDPDYDLGYGQHFQFTFEDDSEGERPIHTPEETIVPFYNAARDTEMVIVEKPRLPTETWWDEDPYFQTKIWFDSPDELFNTPSVPEEHYDPDWYEYRNLKITALVGYPNYEEIHPAGRTISGETAYAPFFDWFVVNFNLGEWELLQAFRWNSIGTQKIENGERVHGPGNSEVNSAESFGSVLASSNIDIEMDAASQPNFYEMYQDSRFEKESGFRALTNPLLASGSRPFCKRAADAFAEAMDNPSFNTIDTQEYHKAIALQTFVGSSPYSFSNGVYSATPEVAIDRWYRSSIGERDGAGNCRDGAHLFNGIAIHLLDSGVANLSMDAPGGHQTAGLLNFDLPDRAAEVWSENHPTGRGAEAFEFETEYGNVSMVECTYPDPMIGWRLSNAENINLMTFLTNTSVDSHIPLNGDFEPDENGEPQTSAIAAEIPWEVHTNFTTIGNIENFKSS